MSSLSVDLKEERTKHMRMSHHHIAGQNHNVKVGSTFTNMAKCKYLGTAGTGQNWIHEEIMSR
jgi:hypothetical protein